MTSRRSSDRSSNQDPNPHVIRIGPVSLPFASPQHPGWLAFYEGIERKHNSYNTITKHLEGLPEKHRGYVIGLVLGEMINQPTNGLSKGAQKYLVSIEGQIDLLVEGICLANPSEDRDHVREQIGGLTLPVIRRIEIKPGTIVDPPIG
jgi:hypothetical protein